MVNIVSHESLTAVYYANIYSHLAYGIIFWGNSSAANKPFSAHKRAIKALLITSGRPLFQFLKCLTLPCLYILSCLMFAKNNLHLFPFNSSIHSHYTRQNSNIHLYDHSLALSLKAPQHSISQIYNKLPENIKGCLSNKSFKSHAINLLTQKAYYSVHEYLNDNL
ncbi:hypothetical protein J437_LFUL007440 [Ladona fulva]|uniref:Uncharacterized protein n=1 Tax=Ladona fulva TaxID=123851 RepID=A0A8K0P2X1_LADFU|nr:hypothetical protein J437_LFUL007440 [Ladona fulva]